MDALRELYDDIGTRKHLARVAPTAPPFEPEAPHG